jgi:heavy metal sensor kinase
MIRRTSIGLRLTAWYALILSFVLVLFAGAIYFTMRRTLHEQLDDTLDNRAFLTQELIAFDADGNPSLEVGANAPNPDIDDTFYRMIAPSGAVLFDNSTALGDVPIGEDDVAAARDGHRARSSVGASGDEYRVVTVPVVREGAVVAILQVGESTGDVQETLNSLLVISAVALPFAMSLAGLGGWWLSRRALAPIDRVTRAAQEISDAGDLAWRLDLDLTDDEVGRLARTFDAMLARLDAAFQRQRQFTADASHELRTPLTAVRGQIDVALERPRDPEEYQRVLVAVNEQVDRMTRLIGGLLMLARSDAGARSLQCERVDLGDLVESVAEQVRPLGERKGLDVRVQGDGVLVAEGDEDLLLQLMLNLADNAIKYTPTGAVTLGWRGGARPELFVRDTGPGIAPEHRARIFERFYRVDAARSREEGGAGLGLAISRWIAEAHGGSLTLESSSQGSTFTVALPASG